MKDKEKKERVQKMEKVKGRNIHCLVKVLEEGSEERGPSKTYESQLIKDVDVAIGFCPFCGSNDMGRDDEMEFVCKGCGKIFFVDLEMDPTGGNYVINVEPTETEQFANSIENALHVLGEFINVSAKEMGIKEQYPDEEIKDYHLLHAQSILACWLKAHSK